MNQKQFFRVFQLFVPGGQTFVSERHLKEFANHIHLMQII